jgi:hypothetical protein
MAKPLETEGFGGFQTVKKVGFATFLSFGYCLRLCRKLPARPAKPVDTSGNQRAVALRTLLKEGFLNKIEPLETECFGGFVGIYGGM